MFILFEKLKNTNKNCLHFFKSSITCTVRDFNKLTHMNVVSYCNQCKYWPLNPMLIPFLGVKWPVQGVYEAQKRKNANPEFTCLWACDNLCVWDCSLTFDLRLWVPIHADGSPLWWLSPPLWPDRPVWSNKNKKAEKS